MHQHAASGVQGGCRFGVNCIVLAAITMDGATKQQNVTDDAMHLSNKVHLAHRRGHLWLPGGGGWGAVAEEKPQLSCLDAQSRQHTNGRLDWVHVLLLVMMRCLMAGAAWPDRSPFENAGLLVNGALTAPKQPPNILNQQELYQIVIAVMAPNKI